MQFQIVGDAQDRLWFSAMAYAFTELLQFDFFLFHVFSFIHD
jgi:hypothetical protein